MTPRTPLRAGAAALAAVLAVAGWATLGASSANARAAYDASARTESFSLAISNPSIPTGIAIEGGGPQAQARQTSLGVGDASAQLPYAGETVPGLPAIGASLFGFEAPPYPFIATSNAGSPPQTVSYPGVLLRAESTDFASEASSTFGQVGAGVTATARVIEERSGDVTATASTLADTVSVGPYVVLSDVRSAVTVTAPATTGAVTRSSSSSIGRITAPGLRLNIPEQSPGAIPIPVPIPGVPNQPPIPVPPFPFPGGGQTLESPDIGIQDGFFVLTVPGAPEPQKFAVPTESALAAFEAQGVTIRFQAPQETENGLISGAYVFEYTIPAPPANTFYNGPTDLTQLTAFAEAAVDLTPVPAAVPGAPGIPLLPAGTDSVATAPVAGAPVPGAPRPAGLDALAAQVPVGTAPAAAVPGASVSAAAPTVDLVQPAVSFTGVKVGDGIDYLYLTIAGLALLGVLAATGVRVLGVR